MTAADPVAFLRATPPFDALPQAAFDAAARALQVTAHPAGRRLVHVGGEPLRHLYVIRRGAVRLERDGKTLQLLGPGQIFGYTSLITRQATLDVQVVEDLLAYQLPDAEFQRLLDDARFARHFAAGLGERLKSSLGNAPETFQPDLARPVGELVQRPPVWVDADADAGHAARAMSAERVSAALVRGDPPGIVTDGDLRSRVLARGLGAGASLADVASRPLRTVPAETPVYEAWRTLLETGVHHLAVIRGTEVVGVLGATDFLRCTSQGPVAVLRRVERLATPASLPGYAEAVSAMTVSLVAGGIDPAVIGGFVARLNDALLRRILSWAEADLGGPPARYAWLALGSEGRAEQTLLTDQDNALVYADEGAGRRDWFELFARRVNADLETAGVPRCPGGYMAQNWYGTLTEWADRFAGWVASPVPQALVDAAIFFDFRRVAGELDLEPLQRILLGAPDRPPFLRLLARAALGFQPPGPLRLALRGDATPIEPKLHGLTPISFLARCYAIEARSRSRSTLDRLQAAADAGLMDAPLAAALADGYRFFMLLRLRTQVRRRPDARPDAPVRMTELTPSERARLREAFHAIRTWQERAVNHFHVEF
jgi:CBS domain-containing protein